MKSATIPPLRVTPELRQAAESVLQDNESLSAFVESYLVKIDCVPEEATGYEIWHAAVARITTGTSAVVQLSVPLITAIAGIWLLQEALTLRLVVDGLVILLEIGLVSVTARIRHIDAVR